MSEKRAYQLPIIFHEIEESPINQRAIDGYINATEMCKAAKKPFHNYSRLSTTRDYLKALSSNSHIREFELIQTIRGGRHPELRGIWVHPQVAIHLAQWLSPKFAVQVSEWVFEWMSGAGRSRLPTHLRRYAINQHKIPHTHFSMLHVMTERILAPLEIHGYTVPDKIMPDISMGKMFSKWCREKGEDPKSFPNYDHEFLDHRPIVEARLYPNRLISVFNRELDNWLRDGRAEKYFGDRDPNALEALGKVLALPSPVVELPNPSTPD